MYRMHQNERLELDSSRLGSSYPSFRANGLMLARRNSLFRVLSSGRLDLLATTVARRNYKTIWLILVISTVWFVPMVML